MSHMDILLERLRGFEETHLMELLDLTSGELVDRFRDVIFQKREQLYGEVELFCEPEDDEEIFSDNRESNFEMGDYSDAEDQ